MKNYKDNKSKGYKGGERGGYKGESRGGERSARPFSAKKSWGGDREEVKLYKATCSDCGSSCQVPFRPSGDKPVLCRECFAGKRGVDSTSGKPNNWNKSFTTDRPETKAVSVDNSAIAKSIEEINNKLDILISIVDKMEKERDIK